jgi:hypothetical protein
MSYELTIIHIEDEYPEYLHLVNNVRVMIEDFFVEEGELTIATTKDLSRHLEEGAGAIFEIVVPHKVTCRYIFVRDETLSEQIIEQIKGRPIFVLDVLRPDASGRQLTSSIGDSLSSVKEFGTSDDDIVLFTAHRGNGLEACSAAAPRRIGKESDGEIDKFFAEKLIECFNG